MCSTVRGADWTPSLGRDASQRARSCQNRYMKHFWLASVLAIAFAVGAHGQRGAAPGTDLPPVDVAALLKTAKPDIAQRIARFKPVRMPFTTTGLSASERQMIDQLVIAS